MTTVLRPLARAGAGEASRIAVQAFGPAEVVTALRNGSGNLELIAWQTAAQDFAVTRASDSGTQAGEVQEVALTLVGRRAITAVRDGSDNLLLISWDVPAGLATITRTWDSGTAAGEASQIAMTAVSDTLLVTALRDGSGNLLLISWRMEPDGTISRLHDSGSQAGEVSLVTIAPVDAGNVLTAVRNGSDNLELIGWSVSPADGSIERWAQSAEAGEVGEIALVPVATTNLASGAVTAVQNGSGNLLLIAWRLSAADGTIDRLADSTGQAGTASDIAICGTTATPSGAQTIVTSMRRGNGELELVSFELLVDGSGVGTVMRTGDRSEPDSDIGETALAALEPGRIVSASRDHDNLRVATYGVSSVSPTLIRPIADASAGAATHIAVQAFGPAEVVTALRNGSGNLELIAWQTATQDFTITRAGDSGTQAGTAQEVALALLGRRAITAVRSGSDNLLLISWDVPPGLATITRTWDSGTVAGEASQIAMTAVSDTLLVTALRDGSGNLLLISWRLEPDGTISRLHDSGSQAGEVSLVTIAPVDAGNVLTAVRNGSDNLELIGWSVSPADGSIERWAQSPEAGEVGEIALLPFTTTGLASGAVTAVQDGSGNLLLIAWRLSAADGTIERLVDSADEAGTASDIAICSTVTAPSGTNTIVASMRRGAGNLELIAFDVIADGAGSAIIVRTGDLTNEANTDIAETALVGLEPGRILSACAMNDALHLKTYTVSDAVRTPAPARILQLDFANPALPAADDTSWAANSGDEYPLDVPREWVQVLARDEDYDDPNLVGCAGWVLAPEDSGADVPFSHPFGFDWEFQIALDDDENNYPALLSPGNADPTQNDILYANALGLAAPRGVLGLEWDKSLLPQSFRGRVNHGDRVAVLGRWIIDAGHAGTGFYRTEIHPPLLVASASVQHARGSPPFTRVVFLGRPFLVGQTYAQHVGDIYQDGVGDDGTLFNHLFNEIWNILSLQSRRVEAHPKIKSFPFRGTHRARFIVRPPAPPPDPSAFSLVVSFRFTVRTGCEVLVTSTGKDQVNVIVTFDQSRYSAPSLPNRSGRTYRGGELDQLSPGRGKWIYLAEALASALGTLVPWGGLWLSGYVAYVLFERGILTDEYEKLPEINILDPTNAAIDVPVAHIPPGVGVTIDDEQDYPIEGWIDVRWERKSGVKPGSSRVRT